MKPTLRLLYAEDSAQDADLTRSHFAEYASEFELQIVTTGMACLEQIQLSPPDLVLLDRRLPDIDGPEMLKALRRKAPGLPVVMVTGAGDEDLAVRALRLGAANYVAKQGNYLESLPDLLRDVLEEHRVQQSGGLGTTVVPLQILYVEHLPMDIDLTLQYFAEAAPHFAMDVVHTCAEAMARLAQSNAYDLALIDLRMPDQSGLDFVREARRRRLPLPPFIMITGAGDEEVAVATLKLGAVDYVVKREGYLNQLTHRIGHAVAREQINRNAQLRIELAGRKQQEQVLKEAEIFKQSILDSVAAQIAVLDFNGVILAVNERWRRYALDNAAERGMPAAFTGVGANYLSACQVGAGLFTDGAEDARDGIRVVLDRRLPNFSLKYSFHSSRQQRWFRMSVTPLGEALRGGVVVMHTDITELERAEAARAILEAQLRESQKMEAIGTLAGGIAHDFNNVIATILGNAELAREDARGKPQAIVSLDEIHKASVRARNLVQQILAFSRRQPTELKLTALDAVVEETVRLLRATLPASMALSVHIAAQLPCVQADANQIEQVLINLITNAAQAMRGRSGSIQIAVDTVLLDDALAQTQPELRALHAKHPGRALRLAVSDDGQGMDEATLKRIFEPFFTTKPVGEGTGLGLSVVYGIVQTHGGALTAHSEPGKGTIFTMYLPAADAPALGNADAPALGKRGNAVTQALTPESAKHILYIDDDEALVSLVTRLLNRRGFRVIGHTNQKEALAALRAEPGAFDLVLTDYNMPGMSGLDVAREVRTIRADLPVAITSGFIDEDLSASATDAGVSEVIFKATSVDEYCAVIQRLAQTNGKITKPS